MYDDALDIKTVINKAPSITKPKPPKRPNPTKMSNLVLVYLAEWA